MQTPHARLSNRTSNINNALGGLIPLHASRFANGFRACTLLFVGAEVAWLRCQDSDARAVLVVPDIVGDIMVFRGQHPGLGLAM